MEEGPADVGEPVVVVGAGGEDIVMADLAPRPQSVVAVEVERRDAPMTAVEQEFVPKKMAETRTDTNETLVGSEEDVDGGKTKGV